MAGLACTCALTAWPSAQAPGDWQSLVDAERAFSAHAVRTTIREAFLAHLHPDGVLFSPGPVNGIALHQARPAGPGQLAWAPEVVDVAASGDFGYSTGPYQFRPAADAPVARQGYFCTVWVRSTERPWQALIDLGATQPEPVALDVTPRDPTPAPATPAGPGARDTLEDAERRLATALPADQIAAYGAVLAPHARITRDGAAPADGIEAGLARLRARAAVARATPEKVDMARSGDMGYARGRLEFASAPADAAPVYYLRVWRHDENGWRVVLDVDTWSAPHR